MKKKDNYLNKNNTMVTVKRLFISLIVLLGCTAGAWAIEQDSDGYYLIGSVQDWKDFAELVNTGTVPAANAKMVRDVDLGYDQTRIGSTSDNNSAPHYKGFFDGQGYKLTIAYVETGGSNLCAPFNKLDGATIKNLHIKGTINTAGIHGAGVASDARGTTLIQNVWSEVDVTSTHSGWDECSGIVGCMKAGNLTITDCLFSGTVTANSSYNGGFIGYKDSGTACISNCLSTGTFAYGSDQDFSRGATVSNSYYTQFVGSASGLTIVTDTQLANGTTAAALQADRSEEIWVQDPVLGIPMLKIFTTLRQDEEGYYLIGSVTDWRRFAELVNSGTNTAANAKMIKDVDLGDDQTYISPTWHGEFSNLHYHGTFDGQGHTLTVHYNSDKYFHTPFSQTSGATIKNLHVAGTIKSTSSGPSHMSGLISNSAGNDVIQNVWVSADITGGGHSWIECGAFVGCNNCGNTTIKDCLFTGSITTTGGNNGCFVGWVQSYNPSSVTTTNCLSTGTFSLGSNNSVSRGTLNNCYVKSYPASIPTDMQLTDEELENGTITAKLQADRSEEVWVQDPETNQPMLKIFAEPYEEVEYFLIGSLQDWKDFAELVETEPTTNGKLIADVDLGDDQTMVGSLASPYQGIFDGQGYTLTVNYDMNLTTSAVAPFAVVGNAVIQKLHVAGSIKQQYCAAGGVVGSIMGNATIRECWVSAYMYVQGYGNLQGTIGGIASCCDNSNARNCTILIEDCVFTGEMATGYHCGSIMSHVNGGYGNSAVIKNCLAIGSYVSPIETTGTFIRVGVQGDPYTIDNCYYKTSWGYVQGTQATETELSDGTTAAALGDAWAQDPGTGNPLPKVFTTMRQDEDGYYLIGSVTDWKRFAAIVNSGTDPAANAKMIADVDLGDDQTMVGTYHQKYQGTFDGQGHTLTFNYNTEGMSFEPEQGDLSLNFLGAAPFRDIEDATICNLHTAGSVTAEKIGASGLVGWTYGTNKIENCWSDVDVVSSNNTADTFAGFVAFQYGTQLNITDCVYTGKIQSASNISHAGFVAFQRYGLTSLNNCLLLLDEGSDVNTTTTQGLKYYTFVRNFESHNVANTINNCYYLTPFGVAQGTQTTDGDISDGTTATALQASRSEEIWVQDPVLGIPMLKIFANEETEQPSEALNGVFTINASGEKVSFAKGNLQKIGSTYQFAEHQYDYFGTDQSDTHRDMFAFLDYNNPAVDEPWSMLSHDEWKYLLITRSVTNTLSADARFTMATIGDTYKGLIIFPDYYEHPEGTGFIAGVFNSNSNYTAQVSLEGWAMMEAAGCVFLPAAGYRSYNGTWYGVGEEIGYMSCTEHPKYISTYFTPYITPDGVYVDETSNKQTWTSIRLVLRKQPITYTVPASGVGTFSSEVNIHLPEGLNAHYCKTYYAERSAISVVNISSGVVPANTGVLLSGTPGETFNLYPTQETADELEGNALVAVTKPVHISPTKGDYTNFMMKGGKFVKIADESYTVKMPANRAYLPLLTEAISGSNAKEIMLYWDEEEATGIESLTPGPSPKGEGSIYNLNGQKLSAPQKGINIINGRKVIVK